MNFDELSKLVADEIGQSVCVICGMPYKPRRPNQKTCGNEGCKREWHRQYQRDYIERLREESPEELKRYRRESQRKHREKMKRIDHADTNYRVIEDRYRRIEEANKNITGIDYGKRQAERTLAMIPKIDVNIVGGKKHDDVHDQNESSGSREHPER